MIVSSMLSVGRGDSTQNRVYQALTIAGRLNPYSRYI